MTVPKINSAHGSDTRNIINRAIEVLNRLGIDVQTLVAEGQLTEKQYAELITVINGHLKSGEVDRNALNSTLRTEVDKIRNKIDKGEVSVHDINKNLGKLDSTYFTSDFLEQLNNGTIDATKLLENSVTRSKIADSSVSEEKTTFINISTNLLNKEDVKRNTNLDVATGEEINSSIASVFNKEFVVFPGEEYTRSSIYATCFYSASGGFLSGGTGNGTFTVPVNARMMKISSTDLDAAKLNKGTVSLPYEPYYYEVTEEMNPLKPAVIENIHLSENSVSMNNVDFIEKSSNLVNAKELLEGYTVNAINGELSENSTTDTSELIEIYPDTNYRGNMARHSEYDVDGKFLVSYPHAPISEANFKSTPSTRFVRVTYTTVYRGKQQLNEGTELLPYEPYYARLKGISGAGIENDTTEQKYFFDKLFSSVFSDTNVYPDYTNLGTTPASEIYAMFDGFMAEYPNYITKTELGKPSGDSTAQTISYYTFSPKEPERTTTGKRPKIFIVCGTHGHEHITPAIVYHTLRNMCEEWESESSLENLRFNVEFIVIPVLNTSGWDVHERINANGVDLNRNFPTDGWSAGDPSTTTWGGNAPASENETQYVIQVMNENPDIDVLIDFHNYHGNENTTTFLWLVTGREKEQNIAQNLLRLMTRKWRKEYTFIPSDPSYFVGTTSGQAGGLMATYGEEEGINLSLTYEQCWRWRMDPNSANYDETAIKTGIEAFTSYLFLVCRYIAK